MARLILSILAGIIVAAVLSVGTDQLLHATGVFPPPAQPFFDNGLLLLAFGYRAVYAVLGAFVTAAIAREKARKAVLVSGMAGSIVWLIGAVLMWDKAAAWYNIAGIVTGVPLALLGGMLYTRKKNYEK